MAEQGAPTKSRADEWPYSPKFQEFATWLGLPAGKDSKNIQLMLGDAECIELPDSFVDVVLALDILEHLDYPNKCLVEIKRVLKPGGKLILSVPHNTLLWRFIWWGWTQIVPYGEHKNYTKVEVVSIMESSGINVLKVYSTHFGCLLIAIGEVRGVGGR